MMFLLLVGCTSWIDQEAACGQDIYAWSDDLLAYILTGDGSGTFDLDPEDEPRTSVNGEYDPSNGDFGWTTKYDGDYYYRRDEVIGFGTVFHNGDMDLLWTSTLTDMLGAVTETVYRVQRDDCDMTIATWDASGSSDDAFIRQGSYADGEVWMWQSEGDGYLFQGALRQNLSRTFQYESDDGEWQFTSIKPDGESTQQFTGECITGYYCEGESTLSFGGDTEGTILVYEGDALSIAITTEYAWSGAGVEHHEYEDGTECDFTTDEDLDCTYECDDGQDGAC